MAPPTSRLNAAAVLPGARPLLGLLAALLVVLLWAGFLLLSRYGVREAVAPVDMAALRFGVSGAVMLPVLWHFGFGGLVWWRCLVLAFTGGLGFAVWVYVGFTLAPAAYGAILLPGMLPLYTTLIAWVLLGDRPGLARLLPLTLILGGVVSLGAGSLALGDDGRLIGAGLFLMSSFMWACFTVLLRRWQIEAIRGTAVVTVVSAALYLPLYLAFLPVGVHRLDATTLVVQGVYQGIFSVIVALLAFAFAVRNLGPTTTTMITALTPAVVALAAVVLLDEPLTVAVGLGATLVVAGGILTARAATRR